MIKVNKPTARKMYNSGITISLLPCKVSESVLTSTTPTWCNAVNIDMFSCEYKENKFDRTVNNYEYYNCNAELGYYTHFYVSEEDLGKYEMCKITCN